MKKLILLFTICLSAFALKAQYDTTITFIEVEAPIRIIVDTVIFETDFYTIGTVPYTFEEDKLSRWMKYDSLNINAQKFAEKYVQFRYLKDGTKQRRVRIVRYKRIPAGTIHIIED